MKLHFRKLGEGQPLIILHGLFGSSDNWQTVGKLLSEHFEVYLVDQRNHGHSPHSDWWNYQSMSDDLFELITDNHLESAVVLGHSMGGKTAMLFAIEYPAKLERLIIADIAPKYYPVHHHEIIKALTSINLDTVHTRKEAEEILSQYLNDFGTKQLLLKSLYWKEETAKKLDWRFNLRVISKNIEAVGEPLKVVNKKCFVPALFLRGEKSKYVLDSDFEQITKTFPNAQLKTIANAGHWLHAEQPILFVKEVIEFLHNKKQKKS